MNKLTAEKCRELIAECQALQDRGYLSISGCYKLQALEIALPVLEQEENETHEWIEWRGGNQPVDDETRVIVKLEHAGEQHEGVAGEWEWMHEESSDPIIAYRLVKSIQPATEANPQIDNDGWIEWGGGDSPIKPGATVQFKMRGGEENTASHGLLDWSHEGLDDDIIAYRVIENDGREG